MAKARADGKPLVYIGFGSIVVEDPKAMTRHIVKGVLKSDVRAILNKGWSARMASAEDDEPEVELPEEVYSVSSLRDTLGSEEWVESDNMGICRWTRSHTSELDVLSLDVRRC